MRRIVIELLTTAIALLLVGCRGEASGDSWHGSTSDSAGIVVVSNPAEGTWREGGGWRLEEDLSVGARDGDPEYLFGQIAGICVGSSGRIYVVDLSAGSIRVYSPDGSFINAFGRTGSGPGELGASLGPCLTQPGDTLAIPDLQNFRVNRYSADGTPVGDWRFDVGQGIPLRWDISAAGKIATQLRFGILDLSPNEIPDAIVWWTGEESPGDTLLRFPARAVVPLPSGRRQYTLLASETLWDLAPDGGVAVAESSDEGYRLIEYDSLGNALRVISRPAPPHEVTETDRRILREAVETVFSARVIEAVMGEIHFAERFPVFFQLRHGPRGSLWVQQVRVPSTLSADEQTEADFRPEDPEVFLANPRLRLGSPDWDVFDDQGRFLGVVTMPRRFEPIEFTGDAIYGIWRDEMDVEYVRRLRIMIGR